MEVNEIEQPLRFQGQYHDLETGLYYNFHRYYAPDLGRYITADPIKLAGGLNNYQYTPNPINWFDSLGLNSRCPDYKYKNIEFSGDIKEHMTTGGRPVEPQKGVSGAHNKEAFIDDLKNNPDLDLKIETEIPHPTVDGISEITYSRRTISGIKNPDGSVVVTGRKTFNNPKTVYDPSKISDADMFNWGQEAAASGYQQAVNEGKTTYSSIYNGIKFTIYLDRNTKKVTNFHPSMKGL